MKMSRMEKYHNQEVPKESKQYQFFKNVGIGCGLIMVLILGLYFITQFTTPSKANNHNSLSTEEKISVKSNSEESSSASSNYSIKESQSTDDSSITKDTSEVTNNSQANDNDNGNIPPQGSNQTFNSLQDAINYGKQNVANGTCSNYRVVNLNGKFRTELF